MLKLAHQNQLPIIDLSRTFDPQDESHYGTGNSREKNDLGVPWSGAEPSNVSSKFIAQLAMHIIKTFKVNQSLIYYGKTEGDRLISVESDINNGSYAEAYKFGKRNS